MARVEQFMTTDLFTVRPDDIVDFAVSLMDWRHIRHVPVEGDDGELVGMLSHRAVFRLVAEGRFGGDHKVPVREMMIKNPATVNSGATTVEAIRIMRDADVACLPVVDDGKLLGLITEHDLLGVSSHLLERYLQEDS